MWRNGSPPDCLASHAGVPGSNPAPFSMLPGEYVNDGLGLRPVYRHYGFFVVIHKHIINHGQYNMYII